MIDNNINKDNFYLFAAANYVNPQCPTKEELDNDLIRYTSINVLFRRYTESSSINVRLILNHFIILHNVFGIEACNIISFYKIQRAYHSQLKTFLVYLNILKESDVSEIKIDNYLLQLINDNT